MPLSKALPLVAAVLLLNSSIYAQAVIDATTMTGKFMMGYQGWHSCKGDGSIIGQNLYIHWGHNGWYPPGPTNTVHDMWPDLSEFDADELFPTYFTLGNGQPAKAYSAYKEKTVVRHFKWMKDHNIDGAMLQRFIKDIKTGADWKELRNKNLQNVRVGAETHGRVFCIMYDISWELADRAFDDLTSDWTELMTTMQVTNSSRYLRHRGKPVVGLWGFGFDRGDPAYNTTPQQTLAVVNWFKANGCTVVGGVPYGWRTLTSPSLTDTNWAQAYRAFDVISPWVIGHYEEAIINNYRSFVLVPDVAECKAFGIDYMPIMWPGYSAYNLGSTATLNTFPRNGGQFFWKQIYNAVSTGCTMMYGGMFDEIEESTALYKVAPTMNESPATSPTKFFALNADGHSLPSDWYLRLTDQGGRMLRRELFVTETIPITTSNSITLLAPVGGELWQSGTQAIVRWSTTGVVSRVNIELTTDDGGSWSRLASAVPNAGSNIVTVPSYASTNCRVRVMAESGSPAVWSPRAFTIQTNAPKGRAFLKPLWSIAPGTRSYVTVAVSSTPNQRAIGYYPAANEVYLISRTGQTTGLTMWVLDATTGQELRSMNTTGISGGTINLLGCDVAEDGAIYAANMTGNASSVAYRLYRWANSASGTAPVLVFSGEPAGRTDAVRWGDTLSVRGSGTNTQIIIDAQTTNLCAILVPTNSTLTKFSSVGGVQSYLGIIGRSLQFGEGNTFWQKRKGDRLQQSSFTFDFPSRTLTTSVLATYTNVSLSLGPCAVDGSRNLFAAINFTTATNAPDTLDLYDFTNPTNSVLISKHDFPTNRQGNVNFIGQVLISGDRLFAINGNNGVLAFEVIAPPSIQVQPQNVVAKSGTNVSVSVQASGAGLSFQWKKDGVSLANSGKFSGVTTSGLSVFDVRRSDSGNYTVTVTNILGSVTSSNATLRVLVPQQFQSAQWNANGNFELLFADADGGVLSTNHLPNFEAQASSNLVNWITLTNSLSVTNGRLMLRDIPADPRRFYRLIER